MENSRIYVVVADTVQHPLADSIIQDKTFQNEDTVKFLRQEDTQTIQQPAGRCAAQVGHVVSKVRVRMVKEDLREEMKRRGAVERLKRAEWYWETLCEPITTIVLAARDSFELNHIYNLLLLAKLPVEEFLDTNPEYGEGEVRTAIATLPLAPSCVDGILDYLPLWTREQTGDSLGREIFRSMLALRSGK